MSNSELKLSIDLSPAEPLGKMAPTKDENGGPVSDLLMIIPKLKYKPEAVIRETFANIEFALMQHNKNILFANVDMKLNTLWVSFKAVPGVYAEIVSCLKINVPEAVLVGDVSSRVHQSR